MKEPFSKKPSGKTKTLVGSTYHIFFSNLSNPLRIKIVSALKKKNLSVSELVRALGVEQSKLSHALRNLRECNVVNVKQRGKERIYGLNKKTILPMLKLIDKHSKEHCKGKCKHCRCSPFEKSPRVKPNSKKGDKR